MSGEPLLSVVIPAYNEAARLPRHIEHIRQHLRDRAHEVIVVDDGSRDDTASVAESLGARVIRLNPNRGKGGAVKAGMLAARGRYVLFTDADESTPIGEVDKLLARLESGYDVAIGSRAVPGAEVKQPQAWYRALAGRLFGLAARALVVRGVHDTQCGFKLFRREVAHAVFPEVESATAIFDIELLARLAQRGYRVAEVPVQWVHDPDTRIPYNLRKAIRIWAELFRIKRRVGRRQKVRT
ncbi:MAG: glycosyltransferase family 2 protein [Verrucomicrobiae bacterium]|nr:glycosyltransferase family 2 protein [Verrucomicrobiae bacterium]